MSKYKQLYHAYLQSDLWRRKRFSILLRDHHWCQGCAMVKATQVHHLSYDNVGQEEDDDLISLCKDCHELAHEPGPVDWGDWWSKLFYQYGRRWGRPYGRHDDRDRTPYRYSDGCFLVIDDGGGSTLENMKQMAEWFDLTDTRAQFLWALLQRTPVTEEESC